MKTRPVAAPLPLRYQGTDYVAPNRSEESEALRLASPSRIVETLGPVLGEARRARLDQAAAARLYGLVVVLEDLHDPHNGGAALRSCEAVGISEVHVIQRAERFRTSTKITQGCDKWLDVVQHGDTAACLDGLRDRGFALYAAIPGATTPLEALDPLRPAAFLIGNEHAGLSPEARARCDVEFAIPLHGFSESLNLSVATALVVYTHATRRRQALGRAGDLDESALTELRARYYARDLRSAAAILRHSLSAEASPSPSPSPSPLRSAADPTTRPL